MKICDTNFMLHYFTLIDCEPSNSIKLGFYMSDFLTRNQEIHVIYIHLHEYHGLIFNIFFHTIKYQKMFYEPNRMQ